MRPRRSLPIVAAVLVGACGPAAGAGGSWDEVARAAASGGRTEAVLVETNAGATASFGYRVFVVAPGERVDRAAAGGPREVARLYGAVRNEAAYGATLRWAGADTIAVEYLRARLATLERASVAVGGRPVHVVLRPGVPDAGAPPGGMFYNLEQRRREGRPVP